jgi:hypothetical protein
MFLPSNTYHSSINRERETERQGKKKGRKKEKERRGEKNLLQFHQ